jgi:hypothetical protein
MSKRTPEKIRVNGHLYVRAKPKPRGKKPHRIDNAVSSKAAELFGRFTDRILENAWNVADGMDVPPVEIQERLWEHLVNEMGETRASTRFENWFYGLPHEDRLVVRDYLGW